jgi:esterase/lipase superfamily enzyme
MTPPAAAPAGTVTSFDTTWYVSARARQGGRILRAVADSLEYGFVVTRFRERVGPGSDGRYVEGFDETRVDSARLPAADFLRRVHAADSAAGTRGEGTIVYVHGFAVSFGRALGQAAEIAHRGSFRGPMIAFEWPAHTALATWPTPSALISRAYRQDSASASASRRPFLGALAALVSAVRPGAMSVVGHSLGAQLVAEALTEPSSVHDSLEARPLGAVALFAPDIPVARFRDSLAARLEVVAARRIVYASSSDWMLGISRLVNHAPRAGRTGAARTLAAHDVEVVDVTRGRRVDGSLRKLVEPRHAMRWASSALYDFFGVVRGLPAGCRAADGVAARQADGTWQLTSAPIPTAIPPAAEACAER